jgi:hypothetical protein
MKNFENTTVDCVQGKNGYFIAVGINEEEKIILQADNAQQAFAELCAWLAHVKIEAAKEIGIEVCRECKCEGGEGI